MQTKSLQTKRALRTTLLVLLLSLAGMGKGYAQNFTVGDLIYSINNDGTTVTLCGHVDGQNATGTLVIPENVNYDGHIYSVSTIRDHAFFNCSGFTGDLVIPNSVTSISDAMGGGNCFAFAGCSGFTGNLTISNSLTKIGHCTFYGCSGLTSVTIPNSVTSIDESAFYGCTSLTSVNIPNSVTFLSGGAFAGCTSLTSINIPNSVTRLGNSAFSGCTSLTSITIPSSVVSIGETPFIGCSNLTNIYVDAGNAFFTSIDGVLFNFSKDNIVRYPPGRLGDYEIPGFVKAIEGGAFYGCFVTSITIPNSVIAIGISAFRDCINLTFVNISNSVASILAGAFMGCSNLNSVNIPNSVTTIEDHAFYGCTNLTSVTIPDSVTTISEATFGNCTNLASATIPNSVTFIGHYAFYGCSNLNSITIPNSVIRIGDEAFYGCTGLTSITIPNSVTSIGSEAFKDCTSLASITIPNSVTSIEDEAFVGCTSLREVNFNAQDCTLNAGSVWKDCHDIVLNIGCCITRIMGCLAWSVISIDDVVESINSNVFYGCDNLTTIIIGKFVKSIGSKAFANNPRLNMIYYNVEKDLEASTDVFENCPNLTTIHIGPEVQEIGSNIFKGCNTVHFVVAFGPTPAVLDAGAFSDIVDNSVLMVSCGKRVTYYSVWNMFPFNNIIEDCDTYGINVGAVGSGGTITPSVTEAQMGQEVQITITPNPGMALVSIKVVNANDPTQIVPISPTGKAASTYSFTMPPFEVVVMATFKNSGTSVGENNSVEVAVYPNPTNGLVKIESENIKHITISNMLGQVVFDGHVDGDAFEYDFSGQKTGIYLVRIETACGVAVKKVSVTR